MENAIEIGQQSYTASDENGPIGKVWQTAERVYKVCLMGSVIQFPLEEVVQQLGLEPSNGGDGMYVAGGNGDIYDLNEIVNKFSEKLKAVQLDFTLTVQEMER